MSATAIGLLMMGAMLLLMAARLPIALAMFLPGALGYWALTSEVALFNHLKGLAVARLTVYELSVIPLFLLMGQFATQGGLSRDLFRAASSLLGRVRGGWPMASLVAAGAFGAVCGSSVATTATITQVAYPELKARGVSGGLSTATLAAGGTLGILIPPSVPLVVYAILTEQNIVKLFAAAIVPGLLALIGYLVVAALMSRRERADGAVAAAKAALGEEEGARASALRGVWPLVGVFALVFGGIYGGLFSPTEGAAVGALSTLLVGWARGELGRRGLQRSLLGTAETSAMVFLIFLGADMMNASLALTGLPAALASWVGGLEVPPLLIVAALLAFYVLLGCVMDELSMLLLTIPVVFPLVMGLDLVGLAPEAKAIWFGVLVLTTVGIGLIAPPIGLNVYVVHHAAPEVPMAATYRAVMPYLAWDAMRLLLLLFVPGLSLGVLSLLG